MSPGQRLRRWRRNADLTQYQLAIKLGVNPSTVTGIERQEREPLAGLAEKIRLLTEGEVTWLDDDWAEAHCQPKAEE
jgi:transcriptional regulator with XRE-family HTH domain